MKTEKLTEKVNKTLRNFFNFCSTIIVFYVSSAPLSSTVSGAIQMSYCDCSCQGK